MSYDKNNFQTVEELLDSLQEKIESVEGIEDKIKVNVDDLQAIIATFNQMRIKIADMAGFIRKQNTESEEVAKLAMVFLGEEKIYSLTLPAISVK